MSPLRAAFLVLPATAVLSGCGSTKIDQGKAERFIRSAVVRKVGARVKAVSCPSGIEAKKGDTFTCAVTGDDGSTGKANIRQTDDKGNVNASAPFLAVRDAERRIAGDIKQKLNVTATVACPEIMPALTGRAYRCKASSQGRSRDVKLTITDAVGGYRYDLV